MGGWNWVHSSHLSQAGQGRINLFQKSVTELLNGLGGISIAQWPLGYQSSRFMVSEPYYIPLM